MPSVLKLAYFSSWFQIRSFPELTHPMVLPTETCPAKQMIWLRGWRMTVTSTLKMIGKWWHSLLVATIYVPPAVDGWATPHRLDAISNQFYRLVPCLHHNQQMRHTDNVNVAFGIVAIITLNGHIPNLSISYVNLWPEFMLNPVLLI